MIAEAKVKRMEERAEFLARNFWIKKLMYGGVDIIESIMRFEELVRRHQFINRKSNNCVLVNALTEVYRNRKEMSRYDNFDIFNIDYWCLIEEIETDVEIGESMKHQERIDSNE